MWSSVLVAALLATGSRAVIYPKPVPDKAPAGYQQWTSPIVVPAQAADGSDGWANARSQARRFAQQLTLEEKVNLTTGVGDTGRCLGNTGAVTRLNSFSLCLHDGPAGVRLSDHVSVFGAGANAASTFDKSLLKRRAEAIGAEFRGKGVNVALAPGMNLAHVAQAGRNWEMAGADPYLTSVTASINVQGIQSQGVIACAKHFIAQEQEHFRGGGGAQAYSSNVDNRAFHEVYALPFAAAVHSGVGAIMCSYNRINQTFACENSYLLNGYIKQELNFQGFVVSDWAAATKGVDAALAGLDSMMPGFISYDDVDQPEDADPVRSTNSLWGAHLIQAVKNGSVPISRVDDMVVRTMSAYYKLKQDEDYPELNFSVLANDTEHNAHINVQSNHKKLIREVGSASAVLLKNDHGVLPLDLGIKTLGIFGSDAGPNPKGPNSCPDRSCDKGTLALGWGSGTAEFPYLVDPYTAVTKYLKAKKASTKVVAELSDDISAVKKKAPQASTCLVFVSADSGEGYHTVEGNQGDRKNLKLWHNGDALIKAVADVCPNTIVIGHLAGPVDVESWINHKNVKAFIDAGFPGQESGNALTDVLYGLVNPSGRTVQTWAKKMSDYPVQLVTKASSDTAVPQLTYKEGLFVDYRWFDAKKIAPRFEFGFGLSYTSFRYSGLSIKTNKQKRTQVVFQASSSEKSLWGKAVEVSFKVRNVGKRDGHEVSQLYLSYPKSAKEPIRVLRGFERTLVKTGQTATVQLSLTRKDISIWDVVAQAWVVPSGVYGISVGGSSRQLPLSGSFRQ